MRIVATDHQTVADCHFGELYYCICCNWMNEMSDIGSGVAKAGLNPVADGVPTVQREGAISIGAKAMGALAVGVLARGALAIGKVAIGQLTLGWPKLRRGRVEELMIAPLTIRELKVERVR